MQKNDNIEIVDALDQVKGFYGLSEEGKKELRKEAGKMAVVGSEDYDKLIEGIAALASMGYKSEDAAKMAFDLFQLAASGEELPNLDEAPPMNREQRRRQKRESRRNLRK